MWKRSTILACIGFGLLIPAVGSARTKLTTLPPRETVRIDLASSQQALSEEDRTINLVAGNNQVDFSWAGTNILMDSIQIRVLEGPGTVNIISTSYPPNEAALVWDVWSEKSGPTKFRISYLIQGFEKRTDYVVTSLRDESKLDIDCRANLGNYSGESFASATLQLGKRLIFADREMLNQQVRRMLGFEVRDVPLMKTYEFNPHVNNGVRFFYSFANQAQNASGVFGNDTLPGGKARVYIQDGENSETFLGEDYLNAVPAGQKGKIYLGLAKEIKCERAVMKTETEQVIFNRWYHQHIQVRWQLDNFKKETVALTIEEPMDNGEWVFDGFVLKEESGERDQKTEVEISKESVKQTRENNNLLKFEVTLPNTGDRKVKWNLYANYTLRNRGF